MIAISPDVVSFFDIGMDIAEMLTLLVASFSVYSYFKDKRKEHEEEEDDTYSDLASGYNSFMAHMLENPEIWINESVTDNQILEAKRRMLYEMLIALFEQSYILLFDEVKPTRNIVRMQSSWNDWMSFWCRRQDFRSMLPLLLEGEDPEFAGHISSIARQGPVQSLKRRE